MPPQGAAYNVDWVLSNTSNVHIATDRAWLTDYTPFRTKVSTMPGAEPSMDIHGIGTVVLLTRTHREGKPHKPSREITLQNVLYAPHGTINILATRMEPDLDFVTSNDVEPIIRRGTNKVIGLAVSLTLCKLWLKGQSKNQSSLDPDALYYVHASWNSKEFEKYKKYTEESQVKPICYSAKVASSPPLTTEEKQLLKKHYGNEYKFLMSYLLSIYKEDDRGEGRRILRALMSNSEDEPEVDAGGPTLEDDDDDQDSVESNEFLAEMTQDPTSHLADYKFSLDQLDFVKKHYGHSGHFMRCYGLKPYHGDDDCDEAFSTLKALMSNSDDENEDENAV